MRGWLATFSSTETSIYSKGVNANSSCPLIYRLRFREHCTQLSFQMDKATPLQAAAWEKPGPSPDCPAERGM